MANFTDGATDWIIDRGVTQNTKPQVYRFGFGDGYEQRISKGINNLQQIFNVTLKNRTSTEVDELDQFFQNNAGTQIFAYHPLNLGETEQSIVFNATNKTLTGTGFSATILTPETPDMLVVTGTTSNDGSLTIDKTATNSNTVLTVIDTITNETSAATTLVGAAYGVIVDDWTVTHLYETIYTITATFKRYYQP